MKILGVRIDNFIKEQALQKVSEFLNPDSANAAPGKLQQHKIFTPNPEMLVDAQKDEYFRKVLNSGDLNVCDGVGLSFISCCKRIPGTDLMQDICAVAEKEGKSVYLLGSGSNEVVKKTVEVLQNKYHGLKIVGFNKGLEIKKLKNLEINYEKDDNDEILHDIIMLASDILFVAFGHGKQEKWIYENLKHLPSVKIAMGVGGAFDYISGRISRAPLFLRKIGLEWIYRLLKEPKRIGRVWKATVQFLFLYFKNN